MEDNQKTKEEKNPPSTPPFKKEEGTETLATELEACKKQAEEYLNGWKRAKADYLNLKKENETASAELAQFVAAAMLLKILPVYDGLKRACQRMPSTSPDAPVGIPTLRRDSGNKLSPEWSASEVEGWAEGILNIKKQFEGVFKKMGIEEIKTVGEKFNPEFHEAVSREKQDGVEPDVVVKEVSGGYMMGGKTIIPAKVIVNG